MRSEAVDSSLVTGWDIGKKEEGAADASINKSFMSWLMVNRGMKEYNARHETQRLGKLVLIYDEITGLAVPFRMSESLELHQLGFRVPILVNGVDLSVKSGLPNDPIRVWLGDDVNLLLTWRGTLKFNNQ